MNIFLRWSSRGHPVKNRREMTVITSDIIALDSYVIPNFGLYCSDFSVQPALFNTSLNRPTLILFEFIHIVSYNISRLAYLDVEKQDGCQ